MTRTIALSKGQFATVDADDYERFSQFKWHALWCKETKSFYAWRWRIKDGIRTLIGMHREVLGLEPGDPRRADHVESGATLLNTKSNLRIATAQQNCWNRRISSLNTSGYKGVNYHQHNKKWVARVAVAGKRISIGYFHSPKEAFEARKASLFHHHGEFARA